MAAGMINSSPDFHRIHPYKVLDFVIPYHIELLLANRTWLIGKSWVGWYRDVLVLRIGCSERCSKCSSCGIGGGICKWSILRIVTRFNPFLDFFSGGVWRDRQWNDLPIHQRTSFDSGPAWQSRLGVGSFENANPNDGPSSLYPLL